MDKKFLSLQLAPSLQVTDQTLTEFETSKESLEKRSVDITGQRTSVKTNNSQSNQPIPQHIRALDVAPEEDIERGDSQVLAPIEERIYSHDTVTAKNDPSLPIAVAVPISKPQGSETRDDHERPIEKSQPSNDIKTTKAIAPPEPILPLTSSPVGSLELSPAFRLILAILFGLTILLAWVVVGTLVVKGIMYHYTDEW